jgi:hypothetical protein
MRIPFSAYAADCTVTGEVAMDADRLSDALTASESLDVDLASLTALDDGRVVEAGSTSLLLDDLCLVVATGPRGRADRRIWTRQLPARAKVGPYEVLGYIHGAPTVDPFRTTERRAVVALTSSVVEYQRGGETVRDEIEAILLNRRKVDVLEPVSPTEFRPGGPGPSGDVDPHAKDLTYA